MLRRRLVGADTLEKEDAVALVERTLEGLLASRAYAIARVETMGARVETLYFDGPGSEDWPAFVITGQQVMPALTSEIALMPE